MIALGQKGALSEHLAVAYLLRRGFEVYRNVSMHGPIDLIAIRGAETLRLDVKTRSGNRSSPYGATEKQIELGVKLLLVDPETGDCAIADPALERQPIKCAECGTLFKPRIARQLYCNTRCSQRAYYARSRNSEHRKQYQRDYRDMIRAKAGRPPAKRRRSYQRWDATS